MSLSDKNDVERIEEVTQLNFIFILIILLISVVVGFGWSFFDTRSKNTLFLSENMSQGVYPNRRSSNDYPVYCGELEGNDTIEYIQFVKEVYNVNFHHKRKS